MSDLSTLLARAGFKQSENSGDTGDAQKVSSDFERLHMGCTVTNKAKSVVTPVTYAPSVTTTVAAPSGDVVIPLDVKNVLQEQDDANGATTVTGVTTKCSNAANSSADEAPRYSSPGRCHVCDKPAGAELFVPILSPVPGAHFWMHDRCWPEHCQRETRRRARGKNTSCS